MFFEEQKLFSRHTRGDEEIMYRAPKLLVSKKGTVFCFPGEKVGRISDEAKGNFVLRRSFDSGKSWEDIEILKTDDHPRVSCGYQSGVADLETGRVIVFFGMGVAIYPEDIDGAWPEKWKIQHPEETRELQKKIAPHVTPGRYIIWTDDEGENWSEPELMPSDSFTVLNPVTGEGSSFGVQWSGIQLQFGPHKGRLVVPGRGRSKSGNGVPFDPFAYIHNFVGYSDDHGKTWQAGGLAQNGTGEACVVELADGTVYLNSRNESLRCRGYRAWDRSADGGETFTESGYDLNLPEPHCQASIFRYSGPPDEKSRILFCNPAVHSETNTHYDHAGRRNLTVSLSEDECRTWPVKKVITEGTAGYSAIVVTPDKTIICSYETLTEKSYSGEIIVTRFDLEWLNDSV